MLSIRESGSFDIERRVLLLAVDDNDRCENALGWLLDNLYRSGDVIHLLHVVARRENPVFHGAPAVDELPSLEQASPHELQEQADTFLKERFLSKLQDLDPQPVVHMLQAVVDQDNVGNIICKKALELQACTLVMAGSHVSQLQQFMMGSVLRHCTVHCKVPIMIVQ